MRYIIIILLPHLLLSQEDSFHRIQNSPYPFSSKIDSLIVLYDNDFSIDEIFTIEILQGQLAKIKPRIYRDIGTGSSIWIKDLEDNYDIFTDYSFSGDYISLLAKFKTHINGYIIYDENSINEVITLCSILNAIPIKEDQLNKIADLNISYLDDARNYTIEQILTLYPNTYNERITIYQNPNKKLYLADYSVFSKSITFFDSLSSDLTSSLLSRMHPNSILLGASEDDEYQTIKKATDNQVITQMSDYAVNLSTLTNINTNISQNYHELSFNEYDSVHTVCFVMTDGDNIQWLLNWFYTDNRWFGNHNRGEMNIGWTISPALSELAPTVMQKIYTQSANNNEGRDYFIAAPSGLGYIFPEKYSELNSYCNLLNKFMIKADLKIVNIIGNNSSSLTLYPYLIQEAIKGVFYYDYSNYSNLNGLITFYNNKPIICARYNLWGGFETPSSLIEKINKLPKDPYSNEGYSLIPVHNWSYSVDSLIEITNGFDENINVVAPDEFINIINNKLNNITNNNIQLVTYPNPTNNQLVVEYLGNYEEIKSINVYSINGQKINVPLSINPTNSYLTKIIIDLDQIKMGTYFLSLLNFNNQIGSITFIKR